MRGLPPQNSSESEGSGEEAEAGSPRSEHNLGGSANCNLKLMQLEAYSKLFTQKSGACVISRPTPSTRPRVERADETSSNAFDENLKIESVVFLNLEARRRV